VLVVVVHREGLVGGAPDLVCRTAGRILCAFPVIVHLYDQTACVGVSRYSFLPRLASLLTIVEFDARLEQLCKDLMRHRLEPDMLQDEAHLRVVSKISILLVKAEVGGVEVEDERGRLAIELLQYVLGGGHEGCGYLGHVAFVCLHGGCAGTNTRESGAGVTALSQGL
jgi:hypothetical protein